MVPLLCISALDDPVCTREAIPWDECRFSNPIEKHIRINSHALPCFCSLHGFLMEIKSFHSSDLSLSLNDWKAVTCS
ncbi:unnamed protein product [Camellia sinensis]